MNIQWIRPLTKKIWNYASAVTLIHLHPYSNRRLKLTPRENGGLESII